MVQPEISRGGYPSEREIKQSQGITQVPPKHGLSTDSCAALQTGWNVLLERKARNTVRGSITVFYKMKTTMLLVIFGQA